MKKIDSKMFWDVCELMKLFLLMARTIRNHNLVEHSDNEILCNLMDLAIRDADRFLVSLDHVMMEGE